MKTLANDSRLLEKDTAFNVVNGLNMRGNWSVVRYTISQVDDFQNLLSTLNTFLEKPTETFFQFWRQRDTTGGNNGSYGGGTVWGNLLESEDLCWCLPPAPSTDITGSILASVSTFGVTNKLSSNGANKAKTALCCQQNRPSPWMPKVKRQWCQNADPGRPSIANTTPRHKLAKTYTWGVARVVAPGARSTNGASFQCLNT